MSSNINGLRSIVRFQAYVVVWLVPEDEAAGLSIEHLHLSLIAVEDRLNYLVGCVSPSDSFPDKIAFA